jgi:uncharacterized protein YaiI (UPF0178 family)
VKTDFKVIVDADACPKSCLQTVQRLARQYRFRLITVASFNHNIANTEHVIVGNEKDAADLAVVNRTEAGDIVVTQDWGLAALILGKQGRAIAPDGRIYLDSRIDNMLEERSLLAKFRRGGGRTKGPAKRSPEDDVRFEANFRKMVEP